jgi:hypothetical protein
MQFLRKWIENLCATYDNRMNTIFVEISLLWLTLDL